MNSSTLNQHSVPFPADCTLYNDMGGKPNQFSSLAYTVVVFTIIINATTLPFTILLNLLVMAAVATKGRLQRKSNIALACLATADLMVGIIGQPLMIAVTITTLQGKTTNETCSIQTAAKLCNNFLVICSLVHLLLISAERYLAIMHPYKHMFIVTKFRLLVASAVAWIICSILHLFLLFYNPSTFWSANKLLGGAFIVIIVVCHAIVYKETRRHEKQIAAQQVSPEARENFLKEKRALKLTATVVSVLIFCYLPIFSFTRARNALKDKISLDVIYAVLFATICLATVNSLINPLIYCAKQRQFRIAFIELLFRKNVTETKEFEKRFFRSSTTVAYQERQQEREAHNQREDIQGREREEQHEDNQGGEGGKQLEDNRRGEPGEQHEDNQGGERGEQHEDNQGGEREEQHGDNQGGERGEQHEDNQGGEREEQHGDNQGREGGEQHGDNQGGERGEQHEDNQGGEREEQHGDNQGREGGEQHGDNQGGERGEQHEDNQGGEREEQHGDNQGREGGEQHGDNQGGEREEQPEDNFPDGAVCENVTGLDELGYSETE